MEDINMLYKNDYGIAFKWKRCPLEHLKKINFVFGKTVFHLTEVEILMFSDFINKSLDRLIKNTSKRDVDELTFLETPIPQISLVMDYENLVLLQNLIEGSLLELGIDMILNNQNFVGKPNS